MGSRHLVRAKQPEELSIGLSELDVLPEAAERLKNRWPEVSIIRPLSLHPGDTPEWHSFVDQLGRRNRGKGTAMAVGSMACTFVKATEMGRMLQAKYPKVYDNRKRTIQLHHRFAKNYNQFVRDQGRVTDEALFRGFVMDFDDLPAEAQEKPGEVLEEMTGIEGALWTDASFCTNGLAKYGRNGLGVDISTNPTLQAEFKATMEFLRSEGLDTQMVDPELELHVKAFEAFAGLGSTTLRSPVPPCLVALEPPTMWVNSNEPSYQ